MIHQLKFKTLKPFKRMQSNTCYTNTLDNMAYNYLVSHNIFSNTSKQYETITSSDVINALNAT